MPILRYRLLFVGVNAVPGGPPLRAARRDADAMSRRFAGWGYDQRARHRLLLGNDATSERVLDELTLASAAAPLDLLLFYWAGHLDTEGRKPSLATADGGVALSELAGRLTTTAARQTVLVIDACHAQSAGPWLTALAGAHRAGRSFAAFAAGGTTPMSREDLRRGYFTGALLEQLPRYTRGVPPDIDLIKAFEASAELSRARRREQPVIVVQGAASFRLAPAKARTLPFERRAREGRQPARLIAASA